MTEAAFQDKIPDNNPKIIEPIQANTEPKPGEKEKEPEPYKRHSYEDEILLVWKKLRFHTPEKEQKEEKEEEKIDKKEEDDKEEEEKKVQEKMNPPEEKKDSPPQQDHEPRKLTEEKNEPGIPPSVPVEDQKKRNQNEEDN